MKKIKTLLLGVTFLIVSFSIEGCVNPIDNSQSQFSQPVGEIYGSHTVGQTFVSHQARLSGVDVLLATYARENTQLLMFHLKSSPSNADDIVTITVDAMAIKDNTYHQFSFSPLPDSRDKSYYFLLESPQSVPGNAITIWHSPYDAYAEGELYINGQKQEGDLAFRTYYDYTLGAMARDVWDGVANNWRLIVVAVLMFTLPGYALFAVLLPRSEFDLAERLIVSMGLSLAFVPLATLFCTLAGVRLGGAAIWAMMAVCGGISLISIVRETVRGGRLAVGVDITHVMLFAILALSLIARLLPVRGLAVPPGSDSYHHCLIAQLIVERGAIPDSYEPYAALESFTYHFGFHSIIAFLHWLTGHDVIRLTLLVGQTLNALMVLPTFLFVTEFTKDKSAGLLGALVVGLISIFPAYYTKWGRFTQLTGLFVLPIAITLMIKCIEVEKMSFRCAMASCVALAGLFLSHYRILIFYLLFAFLYLSYKSFSNRNNLGKLLSIWSRFCLIGFFTSVLTLPWLWNLLSNVRENPLQSGVSLDPGFFSMARIQEASSFYSNIPLIALSLGGIFLGLLRKEKRILLLLGWAILLLAISNPYWLRLPGIGMVDFITVVISMFLPASVFAGYFMADLARFAYARFPGARVMGSVAILAIALLGAGRLLKILGPLSVYVQKPDLVAVRWIRDNTPEDAKFLVNSTACEWKPDHVIGVDAGYWIPLLTGRETTVPPMIYGFENPLDEGYPAQVSALSRAFASLDSADALRLLRENKVTHVYVGRHKSNIHLEGLLRCSSYQLIYHKDWVWIFGIKEAREDSGEADPIGRFVH